MGRPQYQDLTVGLLYSVAVSEEILASLGTFGPPLLISQCSLPAQSHIRHEAQLVSNLGRPYHRLEGPSLPKMKPHRPFVLCNHKEPLRDGSVEPIRSSL